MRPKKKAAASKRRLTELFVKKTKTVGLNWDTQRPGLLLRVRESGNKSYCFVYSRHGRPRWYTIGNANAIELADARKKATEVALAVMDGKDPAADQRAERSAGTFSELASKYVEQHAKRHNKSWQQAAYLVERFVLPRWGKMLAVSITRSDVKTLLAKIAAPITANQILASISAIFTWATDEGLTLANPCRGIKRNPTKSRERVLSESEMPKFWKALDGIDPTRAAALRMVLLCGQRPGETAAMRIEHIKDGWWEMPGEASEVWPGTKNHLSHRLWLPTPARAIITEFAGKRTAGYVFASARGHPTTALDVEMRNVCAKAGIAPPVRPHDLRRTFGSLVTGGGHGRQAMDRILNHADRSIGSIYDRHAYSREDQHVMESVASRIVALVEKRGDGGKVVTFQR